MTTVKNKLEVRAAEQNKRDSSHGLLENGLSCSVRLLPSLCRVPFDPFGVVDTPDEIVCIPLSYIKTIAASILFQDREVVSSSRHY